MNKKEVRDEVLELINQKDKIESEIRELTSILTQNGVGMKDPLVDAEGYPISSIDVYQVRNARHRIICLQNDHKSIMKRIENGVHGYYSAAGSDKSREIPMDIDRCEIAVHQTPFAKVTLVSPGSPAEYAGFIVNDEVVEFGSVNFD
ncbi:hypothetical protein NQ318_008698 [Aromia moschata]|uniref:Nas2 N-terminal domain-containing protein n=1 Tax=Aromia moschata TaxID=1265417 RepID=A0AAV8X5G5_9CUCU|nr:hypothetical protein NQ318_008698 [Aromia moschata]